MFAFSSYKYRQYTFEKDEIRHIVIKNNAAINGILELKHDNAVLDSEVNLGGYAFFQRYGNRNGDIAACYIIKDV